MERAVVIDKRLAEVHTVRRRAAEDLHVVETAVERSHHELLFARHAVDQEEAEQVTRVPRLALRIY